VTTDAAVPTEAIQPDEFLRFISDPGMRADPYPFYARLRAYEPVHQVMDIWLASGYDVVSEILRDGRFSADERNSNLNSTPAPVGEFTETPFGRLYFSMLLFRDDPDHKRLRDLVQKAFTRKVVEDLRPRIQNLVDGLVAALIERGSADLMSEVAYPLPIIVICELLGVPPSDRHLFHDKAKDFASRFEIQPLRTPESEARGDAATEYFIEYFDRLIEEKRREPGHDLLSNLVAVEDEGDRLTHDELLGTCLLILFAGHETTANLIGNGVCALQRNHDQWERLVAEPELARSAVEELLRFDSPVQIILRVALEDVSLGGRTVPAGSPIGLLLAAANRDESHFAAPDRLDIGPRSEAPLVAFGGGIHFCLGAPLARLEAQIMLATLARKIPNLSVDGDAQWRPSFVIRGLESLPVSVS
jgi:cytochrome P450